MSSGPMSCSTAPYQSVVWGNNLLVVLIIILDSTHSTFILLSSSYVLAAVTYDEGRERSLLTVIFLNGLLNYENFVNFFQIVYEKKERHYELLLYFIHEEALMNLFSVMAPRMQMSSECLRSLQSPFHLAGRGPAVCDRWRGSNRWRRKCD